MKFPESFLWGVSTSAYQTEGGITNNWSEWETSLKRIKALKEKGFDYREFICGKACDSYNRYQEDIDLAKALGCNIYRFGIEWARLEPAEGEFNQEEFEHYRKMIAYARKQGVKVMLQIWHWTDPLWLTIEGGWENRKVAFYFERFAKKVACELGKQVDYWVVLNEPWVPMFNGYVRGNFPPGKRNPIKAMLVYRNLAKAYKGAAQAIRHKRKEAKIGFTQLATYFEPSHKWNLLEVVFALVAHFVYNLFFIKLVEKELDYIGVDYYFHNCINWRPPFSKNENKETNDMGWEIYPRGIYKVVKKLAFLKKPIIIIENGLADASDSKRAEFIKNHLKYLHKAISEGVPVIGYCHWSLLDNFEWACGWAPKFGLFEVDRETFIRRPRKSAKFYAKICKNNSIEK